MQKEHSEQVAARIIEQLKQGTAPWQRPWQPGEMRLPYNLYTGKPYRGINSLWLALHGYEDPRWLTYKQATEMGGQVRRGEKGTRVEHWRFQEQVPVLDERNRPVQGSDGKPLRRSVDLERPRVFFATVFNAGQVDGLPPLTLAPLRGEPERHARAEALLERSGAQIAHIEGDRAFYDPGADAITLPARAQFPTADGYYATALHELGHWTGHPDRLNRDMLHPFGSEGYAREELRAEIASLMLGERLEIGHDPGQHAAYVQSWIKALEEDPREIFRAAAAAERMASYVMAFEQEQTLDAEEEQPREREQPTLSSPQPEAAMSNNERTYLAVPFMEKDEAKRSGARWDKEAKSWYAPPGVDVERNGLARWLPGRQPTPEAPEVAFARALADYGLQLDGAPVMDGALHRVRVKGDRGAEKSGAYTGHLDGFKCAAGFIQNYKTGLRETWKHDARIEGLSAEERDRQAREAAELAERRAAAVAEGHARTARVAQALWAAAEPATADHPYCARKGILDPRANDLRSVPAGDTEAMRASGIRIARTTREMGAIREADPDCRVFLAGDLLVPMRDGAADNAVLNLQTVNPYFKGFIKEGRKTGLFTVAGDRPPEDLARAMRAAPDMPLVVAEGYATADTVARLLDQPVIVAFDSGNLEPVARALGTLYPGHPLIFAADNDHQAALETLPNGQPRGNVGLTKAEAAAAKHGGSVMAPRFEPEEKGSDWNDVAAIHGEDVARVRLRGAFEEARVAAIVAAERLAALGREEAAEADGGRLDAAGQAAARDLAQRAILGSDEVRADAAADFSEQIVIQAVDPQTLALVACRLGERRLHEAAIATETEEAVEQDHERRSVHELEPRCRAQYEGGINL